MSRAHARMHMHRRIKDGYSIFKGTIADMTWPRVEGAAQKNAVMLMPIAVITYLGANKRIIQIV